MLDVNQVNNEDPIGVYNVDVKTKHQKYDQPHIHPLANSTQTRVQSDTETRQHTAH